LRCGQAVTCAELAIVRCHLTVGGRLGAVLGGLGAVARGALAKRAGADDDLRAGDRASGVRLRSGLVQCGHRAIARFPGKITRAPGDVASVRDLPARLEAAQALDGDGLCEATLSDAAFAGLQAPGLAIEACVLERVVLAGAQLRGARWRDVELRDCDLANADLRGIRARRVRIAGARLTGSLLSEADLGDVELVGCQADLTAFAGARLDRLRVSAIAVIAAEEM